MLAEELHLFDTRLRNAQTDLLASVRTGLASLPSLASSSDLAKSCTPLSYALFPDDNGNKGLSSFWTRPYPSY